MTQSDILHNIENRLGIAALNPMQIELAATDADNILLAAPTGSGKTLAFIIPLVKRLAAPGRGCRGVVMAPSRELVLQITSVVKAVAAGYKVTALYGGHKMEDEVKSLTPVPDIIIATPGRLLDHINRGNIQLADAEVLVLDEYDKCVELGFEHDMRRIVRRMTNLKSVILTSATTAAEMPDYLPRTAWKAFDYSSGASSSKLQKVRVQSPAVDKADTLAALLCAIPQRKVMVFVNHRESAERLHTFLKKARIPAGLYHGGLDQHARQMAVELLQNGSVNILVATDLAARGLDIEDMEAVVHYHIPPTAENWVHRNGRTARNGAEGTAYIITSEADNLPDYVEWDREYAPKGECDTAALTPSTATLHFNIGKKEKISKGDIVGFLMANSPLAPGELGRITVFDHEAIAAVPAAKARDIVASVASAKLKNKKVRVSRVIP
jgi:superfamily II DNA/RNA helicase